MNNPIPGRAETYEQKRAVMEKVLSYWAQNPNLRLGQLIQNAADVRGANVFYLEDDKLVELLKAYSQAFPSKDLEPCKACETRSQRGFDGQCPACAAERTRNALHDETKKAQET